MGISELLWYFHPHSVGGISLPNHCCSCKYVRKECCRAAALVGGSNSNIPVIGVGGGGNVISDIRPLQNQMSDIRPPKKITYQCIPAYIIHFHITGIVANEVINCDEAVHHGAIAMQKMAGNNFAGIQLRHNDNVTTIAAMTNTANSQ